MILVYAANTSSRLQYICSFIFKEQMQTKYDITADAARFKSFEGVKINYSASPLSDHEVWLLPVNLLFENNIQQQAITCFDCNGQKALYKTPAGDFEFDIFAACFYLLSRYEEYLPHTKDMYGRFAHENSVAYREGFLNQPVINYWVQTFAEIIQRKFSAFTFTPASFGFEPTYDIDMAYSYLHKGWLRNAGGFLQSPSVERIKVLAGMQPDPFDAYDWLCTIHKKYNLQPVYFFLVAQKNGIYDKNILPAVPAMQQLIKAHAVQYRIGVHPGWSSNGDEGALAAEIDCLSNITAKPITISRQHYIKMELPETYRRLIRAGIQHDYSMGYGSINGFRASVASSFYWFDLAKNMESGLRIHPFCFMDANSLYEQKYTPEQALAEMMHYYTVCKKANGEMISIWHNNFLGTAKKFEGWRNSYESFIKAIHQ